MLKKLTLEKTKEKKSRDEKHLLPRNFLSDNGVRFFIIIAATINFISWLLVFTKLFTFPDPIILHYNAYFGIDLEGSNRETVIFPAVGLFILIINGIIGIILRKNDLIIARVLTATALFFNLLITVVIIALILANQI